MITLSILIQRILNLDFHNEHVMWLNEKMHCVEL